MSVEDVKAGLNLSRRDFKSSRMGMVHASADLGALEGTTGRMLRSVNDVRPATIRRTTDGMSGKAIIAQGFLEEGTRSLQAAVDDSTNNLFARQALEDAALAGSLLDVEGDGILFYAFDLINRNVTEIGDRTYALRQRTQEMQRRIETLRGALGSLASQSGPIGQASEFVTRYRDEM